MVNLQKKFQKKKDRERQVRKKILERREKYRAQTKEQEAVDRESAAKDPKRKPICSAQERRQKELRDAEIRRQLQHNIEVLKALEAQYDKESGKPVDPMTITLCEPVEKCCDHKECRGHASDKIFEKASE